MLRKSLLLSLLLALLLAACAPAASATSRAIEEPEQPPANAPALETPPPEETPPCAFVWARRELPELSAQLEEALQGLDVPRLTARAVAYGEDCLDEDGNPVYFATRQTDFYVMLEVESLQDEARLGDLLERVLTALGRFPTDQTPGPNPGYVSITFQAAGEARQLRFAITQAEQALREGLRGADLLRALHPTP